MFSSISLIFLKVSALLKNSRLMRQTLNALGLCIGLGNILVTRPRSTLEGIAIKNEGAIFAD